MGRIEKNCISVKIYTDWLSNKNTHWASNHAFISVQLIGLDKKPGVHPFGVKETWRLLFVKCVLKVTVPEAPNVCQDEHFCAGLKVRINGDLHGVQDIWDTTLST